MSEKVILPKLSTYHIKWMSMKCVLLPLFCNHFVTNLLLYTNSRILLNKGCIQIAFTPSLSFGRLLIQNFHFWFLFFVLIVFTQRRKGRRLKMYSYADLKQLICDSFSPLLAIESSKSAEQTCREAGVSAIQLLRYIHPLQFISF